MGRVRGDDREKILLENRLLFCTERQEYSHSVTFSFYVRGGKNYECYRHLGISHLLEHMIFRGGNGIDQRMLYEQMERMGTRFFGETGTDYICWGITCDRERYLESLRLFLRVLSVESWRTEALRKEREVIWRQIERTERENTVYFGDYVREKWYESRRGRASVMGTDKTLEAISMEDLKRWKRRLFCEKAVWTVLTGNFSENDREMTKMELSKFKLNPQKPLVSKEIRPKRFGHRTEEDIQVLNMKSEYSDISLLFDVDGKTFPRSVVHSICREIGIREDSYLWRMVPEAEELEGRWHGRETHSVFQIEFCAGREEAVSVIEQVIGAFRRLKREKEQISRWETFSYYKIYAENCSEIRNREFAEAVLYPEQPGKDGAHEMVQKLFQNRNLSIYIAGDYTESQRTNLRKRIYQVWEKLS